MTKITDKELEKAIKEVLGDAPKIRGYTLKELKEKISRPWPTERWHFEYVRTPRDPNERIGEAYKKLEKLTIKK